MGSDDGTQLMIGRKMVLAVATMMTLTAMSAGAATPIGNTNVWSGYVSFANAVDKPFTAVSATWTQPAATCNKPSVRGFHDLYASWVGLGAGAHGADNDWLVQTGVITDCGNQGAGVNSPKYLVFWEAVDTTVTNPMPPVRTDILVNPGDRIDAKVATDNKGTWTLTLNLNGLPALSVTFTPSTPTTAINQALSAEVISESPLIRQFPNFGKVTFTNISVSFDNHGGSVPWSNLITIANDANNFAGKPETNTGDVDPTTNAFTTVYIRQ